MLHALSFPDAVPDLVGEGLHLRELTESDIPAWFERATDAESADLAGDPIPESIEAGTRWLEGHRERFRQRAAIRWAIVPSGSSASVGTVGLTLVSNEERRADLGIVVGRRFWGQSVGTTAARLVVGYAFSSLGLAEIRAEVLQRNAASIRLLTKLGFGPMPRVPDEPQVGGESEACSLYVLRGT